MRILMIDAGGVGGAALGIAARREFFSEFVVADFWPEKASAVVARVDDVDKLVDYGSPGDLRRR
jgi:hypothetical protein